MDTPMPMPVVFVGHGSPMNAVQDNDVTRAFAALPRAIGVPELILAVSAHWVTPGTLVGCARHPEQVYDFYGFPPELYDVRYRPHGAVKRAQGVVELLRTVDARCSTDWGTDHGVWAVLRHLFPKCDIPVVQVSLDAAKSPREHYETARLLAPLRDEGVLVLASGNIVHNLAALQADQYGARPFQWAVEFDEWAKERIMAADDTALIGWERSAGPTARYAVPTTEHYLPLLYAAALRRPGENVQWAYEGFQHGSISMRALVIGAGSGMGTSEKGA